MSKGQQRPPVVPGDSGPCLKARGVDQLSLAPRAWVRLPVGCTSSPGRLALLSECL